MLGSMRGVGFSPRDIELVHEVWPRSQTCASLLVYGIATVANGMLAAVIVRWIPPVVWTGLNWSVRDGAALVSEGVQAVTTLLLCLTLGYFFLHHLSAADSQGARANSASSGQSAGSNSARGNARAQHSAHHGGTRPAGPGPQPSQGGRNRTRKLQACGSFEPLCTEAPTGCTGVIKDVLSSQHYFAVCCVSAEYVCSF